VYLFCLSTVSALSADLLRDWREEIIWRAENNKLLRIYSTNIPTEFGLATLMQDTQYRVAVAWQNNAYNQPPHPGFYLGDKMKAPIKPNLKILKARSDH